MIRKRNLNIQRMRNGILSQKTSRWCRLGGHSQTNIDFLKKLNFVQETIQTLSKYSEQLQTHLDIRLTRQEMS